MQKWELFFIPTNNYKYFSIMFVNFCFFNRLVPILTAALLKMA